MRSLGQICLLLAFVGTAYSAVATYLGWYAGHDRVRRSGLLGGITGILALTGVVFALAFGLWTKDFRFDYVARYSNLLLPRHYSISSLWVGQAGSLLLWSWLTGVASLIFRGVRCRISSAQRLRDPTFAILMAFCCFLIAIMVFAVDPMAPSLMQLEDGAGLSPILQHPAMLIHPPIVFLAYAAWTVPFALAVAALATGQLSAAWTQLARPWALFAWSVLGIGILLGANWAYRELGWGGYWAWDPVENGSLIPWLIGTSAIHTLMAWRHRGMFKKSALTITMATFGMCNFATFLTRSGIFSSLHAFSESPVGWSFLGLMIVIGVAAVVLIWCRRAELQSERPIAGVWCRESMVALSTFALISLAAVISVGTVCAAISDALTGRKIILGIAFYNNALIPTGLTVLLATAAAPLLRWGANPSRTQFCGLLGATAVAVAVGAATYVSGVRQVIQILVYGIAGFSVTALLGSLILDSLRLNTNPAAGFARAVRIYRRQYAGFVIHMGLFCLAIGVTASSLGSQRNDVVLHPGDSIYWAGHHVKLLKVVQRELPDKLVVEALLEVQRDHHQVSIQSPAQHFHRHSQEWTTETSVAASWSGDFYTILHSGLGENGVRLTLVVNPMMRWIWLGGGIMVVGSIAALWPTKAPQRSSHRVTPRQACDPSVRPNIGTSVTATLLLATLCALSAAEDDEADRHVSWGSTYVNTASQRS